LGEERFNDLEEGIPYELSINVVYDATEGGPDARGAAEQTCSDLKALFYKFYGDPILGHSELIELNTYCCCRYSFLPVCIEADGSMEGGIHQP
jgi:hypothetical protein